MMIRLSQTLFDRWRSFCLTARGVAFMFTWAVAEAIFFPIVPDYLLMPMAVAGHARFWRIFFAAAGGSALGVALMYLFAYGMPSAASAFLNQLPVIFPFMLTNANALLDAQGLTAFWIQPWSGVSYKVFAVLGAAREMNPFVVIPIAIIARAARMLIVSAVPAFFAARFERVVRDYWLIFFAGYALLAAYVWVQTQLRG